MNEWIHKWMNKWFLTWYWSARRKSWKRSSSSSFLNISSSPLYRNLQNSIVFCIENNNIKIVKNFYLLFLLINVRNNSIFFYKNMKKYFLKFKTLFSFFFMIILLSSHSNLMRDWKLAKLYPLTSTLSISPSVPAFLSHQ